MLDAFLIAMRFVHDAAATSLFGLCLFAALAWPPRRALMFGMALVALISGLGWFAAVTASMIGQPSAAVDPASLILVATQTPFGGVWIARLVLAAMLCLITAPAPTKARGVIAAVLSGLLLASIALTGHARMHEGVLGGIHILSDSVHLLGAGAWLGGLAALGLLLSRADGPGEAEDLKARRIAGFSRVGYGAVGGLVLSGLVNAALILSSPADLISTGYGRLLLVKIGLFAGMLGLALYNRFRVSPQLATASSASEGFERLRGNVLVEQSLGAVILAIVSVLGTLNPAA